MSDDWSRCPICYEEYSLIHRPTTFLCGHSTCIDHTFGSNPLRECPICRQSLSEQKVYNVSYNLEEASRFYHMNKTMIDYSTIEFPSVNNKTLTPSPIYNQEIEKEETETRPITILALILATVSKLKKSTSTNLYLKKCGHSCFLTSTSSCCSCSDQRPHSKTDQYETYVNGDGIQKIAQRNKHYCPHCHHICQVALSNSQEVNTDHDGLSRPLDLNKYQSRKALGVQRPDSRYTITRNYGVRMPLGPLINFGYNYHANTYNEYVVFDESQIALRYLVQFRR